MWTDEIPFLYLEAYVNRHPPSQLPHDPTKKNLVILGNGWASTSLLKSIDTEAYNVVSADTQRPAFLQDSDDIFFLPQDRCFP